MIKYMIININIESMCSSVGTHNPLKMPARDSILFKMLFERLKIRTKLRVKTQD